MAGYRQDSVMFVRRERQDLAPQAFPEGLNPFKIRQPGFWSWCQDRHPVNEKVRGGRFGPVLFGTGDGMTSDKR